MKRALSFFAALAAWAILCLVALPAQAETTVTLGPIGCGITRQCLKIPNDAGMEIALSSSQLPGGQQYLYVDTVLYSGVNSSPAVLYSDAGGWLTLNTSWSTFRTCTRSGRGQHCSTHWQLLGGTVVFP